MDVERIIECIKQHDDDGLRTRLQQFNKEFAQCFFCDVEENRKCKKSDVQQCVSDSEDESCGEILLRQSLVSVLIRFLQSDPPGHVTRVCLRTLRILSRDKKVLDRLLTDSGLITLTRLAGLSEAPLPGDPLTDPTDPLTDPLTNPLTDPTDPLTDPLTDPADPLTDPLTDPTDPLTDQLTDPLTDPTDPLTDPLTDQLTDPLTDPTDPLTDPLTDLFEEVIRVVSDLKTPEDTEDTHRNTEDTHRDTHRNTKNTHRDTHRNTKDTHRDTHRNTEDTHRNTEDTHRDTEDTHRDTEDTHRNTEDTHRDTEDTHRNTEDTHRDTEDTHRNTEDTHRDTEDTHRNTEDTYRNTKDTHRDTHRNTKDTHRDTHRNTEDTHRDTEDTHRNTKDTHRDTHRNTEDTHKNTEDTHRDTEDTHRNTEDTHRDTEDTHRDTHRNTEDTHRDTEDTHRNTEDTHRDTEDTHKDTHRNTEDTHRNTEDTHRNTEDTHRDTEGNKLCCQRRRRSSVFRALTRGKRDTRTSEVEDEEEEDEEKCEEEQHKEAVKILCNVIYNSAWAQERAAELSLLTGLTKKLVKESESLSPPSGQYYELRLIFLLTALRPELRNQLKQEGGVVVLTAVLESCVSVQWRSQYEVVLDSAAPPVCVEASLRAQEVLKILFNITHTSHTQQPDQEEDAQYRRLAAVLRYCLMLSCDGEQTDELKGHTVNVMSALPLNCLDVLLSVPLSPDSEQLDGVNMDCVYTLLLYLQTRLHTGQKEKLIPVLNLLTECCRAHRETRRYLRQQILPPLRDTSVRPEHGCSVKSRLVRLMTHVDTELKHCAADLLFVLCKENVRRLVKYTGYGNAAGLLATRGLLGGQMGTWSGSGFSSDSDSDTEEYLQVLEKINPVTGRVEEQLPSPMEGMTEEEKEEEARRLLTLINKLSKDNMIRPMGLDAEGQLTPLTGFRDLSDEDDDDEDEDDLENVE